MFISLDCYDFESKVKYKAFVQVENIISIEPECFIDQYNPVFDDTCSVIYLKSDCILHSYRSPRDILHFIEVEKMAEAEKSLANIPFFGGKKK